jgi:hypothetical protein
MRQAFNSLPLFSALDVDALETIMSAAYEKRRWRDQAIFCEGETCQTNLLASIRFRKTDTDKSEWQSSDP